MSKGKRCPHCGSAHVTTGRLSVDRDATGYDCSKCGRFGLTGTAEAVLMSILEREPTKRPLFSHMVYRLI